MPKTSLARVREMLSRSDLKKTQSGTTYPSSSSARRARGNFSVEGEADPGARARIEELGRRALPPDLSVWEIPHVVVPPPRKIHPHDSATERRAHLLSAYRGAHEWRYTRPSLAHARGALPEKVAAALDRAASVLLAIDCAPAAWCRLAFEVWDLAVGAVGAPRLLWAYSHRLMVRQAPRASGRLDDFHAERRHPHPEASALVSDHAAMWRQLLLTQPKTRGEVLAVVDVHFPGRSWEARYTQAQASALWLQAEVDQAVAAGKVIW